MEPRFCPLLASGLISALVSFVSSQTTAAPLGCTQNGQFYRPGQEIFRSRVGDWCYGTTCSPKGQVVRWDDFSCGLSSVPQAVSCVVEGKVYQPGDDISESRAGSWCYGKFCDLNGHLVSWNNYDCAEEAPTTLPPTTSTRKKSVRLEQAGEEPQPPPSTTSPPTTIRTCFYNGVTYLPGQQIPDGMGCGFECSENGELLRWPCTTSPPPPTTAPSATCFYNGAIYQPGDFIPDGMGCGLLCSTEGVLLRKPCTTRSTTTPTCFYNGITYQPGQQISDGKGCGFECGPDGQLLPYPCTRPTSPPMPPTTVKTPAIAPICMYNGVTYQPGDQIFRDANGCGFECGPNGELLAYPCQQPTTVPTTLPSTSCFYNGQYYAPGQRFPSNGQNCGGLCSEQGELLFATCVSAPTTIPSPPVTCSYNGVTYSPGQQIPDGRGCGFECSSTGELLPYPCPPPTTTPANDNTCLHEGRIYQPGEKFGEGRSGNWCYGMYCDNGNIVAWDNFQCGETSPPIPTTTPRGCYYNGTVYQPGSTIHRDSAGCGRFCNQQGQIDYYVCTRPTSPRTTTPHTTTSHNSVPGGCLYEGRLYMPGESFAEGREGNWCYGMFCGEDGQAIPWDNFQCGGTTTPIPTTIPPGCYYNGTMYQPGSPIHRDSAGCGRFCNQQGQIDYYVCTRPTSPRTTTPHTTVPEGCVYQGKIYKPGEKFGEGRQGNWCYGMICGENGETLAWDNFQCGESTTPTSPPPPTSSSQQRGCTVDGKFYKSGEEISRVSSLNMCYGTLCDESGDVIAWEDFTCGTTGNTINPQEPVKDCQYQGQSYKPGQKILLADNRGCKVYCSLEGRVRVERFPCITPVTNPSTKTPNSTYAAYVCSSQNGRAANGTRLIICNSGFSPIMATGFLNLAVLVLAHWILLILL